MSGPIKPYEIKLKIPEAVYQVVNKLIKESFNGREAKVLQNDILKVLAGKLKMTRDGILDKHYLDFEKEYGKAGWKVTYQSPDRGDSDFPAYFCFTKV
jgi:hypothetical protein